MCYLIFNKKEYKNRFFFIKYELKKLALKALLSSFFFKRKKKYYWQKRYFFFGKKYSLTYYRNRCLINNWSRSVFRMFKMSRHQSKAFSSFGFVCGLRKASF